MGTGSLPGVKLLGRDVDHPPPSSAEVKKRVELYIYSPFGPSWPVTGWTWTLKTWRKSVLAIKRVFHLSPQLSFDAFLALINISQVMLEMRAKPHVCIQVVAGYCRTLLMETEECLKISLQLANIKFNSKPRFVALELFDANTFCNFAIALKKFPYKTYYLLTVNVCNSSHAQLQCLRMGSQTVQFGRPPS